MEALINVLLLCLGADWLGRGGSLSPRPTHPPAHGKLKEPRLVLIPLNAAAHNIVTR